MAAGCSGGGDGWRPLWARTRPPGLGLPFGFGRWGTADKPRPTPAQAPAKSGSSPGQVRLKPWPTAAYTPGGNGQTIPLLTDPQVGVSIFKKLVSHFSKYQPPISYPSPG